MIISWPIKHFGKVEMDHRTYRKWIWIVQAQWIKRQWITTFWFKWRKGFLGVVVIILAYVRWEIQKVIHRTKGFHPWKQINVRWNSTVGFIEITNGPISLVPCKHKTQNNEERAIKVSMLIWLTYIYNNPLRQFTLFNI